MKQLTSTTTSVSFISGRKWYDLLLFVNYSLPIIHIFYSQCLYDFELQFKESDSNGFKNSWSKIAPKPFTQFNMRLNDEFLPPIKDKDIQNMLLLLKLLHAPRASFEKSTKSLIVFGKVNWLPNFLNL